MVSDMPESFNIAPIPSKVNFKVISTCQIYFSSLNALNKVLVFQLNNQLETTLLCD